MNTPVLLLAWRRPHTTQRVIQSIRKVKPNYFFVACDGPNPNRANEEELVLATRKVIKEHVDWPCQIRYLYSDYNQGCRLGVSRAITWFFNQVKEGIILEDDCVAHPDFYYFASNLLERYRNDTRVWCISGSNFQDYQPRGDSSYYFSRYNHCWGWASWRRCWQHYDSELSNWPFLRDSGLLDSIFEDKQERLYWSSIWQRLFDESIPDSWAYRWSFTCLSNSGLTALPNINLVDNIGFDQFASHTNQAQYVTKIDQGLDNLIHPRFLVRNIEADRYTFANVFSNPRDSLLRRLFSRLAQLV